MEKPNQHQEKINTTNQPALLEDSAPQEHAMPDLSQMLTMIQDLTASDSNT